MKPGILVNHSMIFGDNPLSPPEYLDGISRVDLINIAAFLINCDLIKNDAKTFLSKFFSIENSEFANSVYEEYLQILKSKRDSEQGLGYNLCFVSTYVGIEFLKLVFSIDTGDDSLSHEEIETKVFHSILALNESLTEYDYSEIDSLEENEKLGYLLFESLLPYHDFNNENYEFRLLVNVMKAWKLFQFCENHTPYNLLLRRFVENLKLNTWKDYIVSLLMIFLNDIQNESYVVSIGENDKYREQHKLLFDEISIRYDEIVPLEKNADYKKFKEKPLVDLGNGDYIMISRVMCLEQLYNSLVFKLKSLNTSLEKKQAIKDFLQDFTTRFSEEYLFNNTISDVFSRWKKAIKITGKECRMKNNGQGDHEPDYYVRNWNRVFIIEYKDPLFKAEIKVSHDFRQIKKYIEEKLVIKQNGDISAIEQISYNIKKIVSESEWFEWDEAVNTNNKVQIYPVLVVGNRVFKTPGIAPILKDLLRESLKKSNIQNSQIHDLLLLDIDTLLWFQYVFKEGYLDFQHVVKDYYKFIKEDMPYKPRTESAFVNFLHNTFSFSDYLLDFYEHSVSHKLIEEIATELKNFATADVRNVIRNNSLILNN